MIGPDSSNAEHLGDGVSVSCDGENIWLWLSNDPDTRIALDQMVFNRLLDYERRLRESSGALPEQRKREEE